MARGLASLVLVAMLVATLSCASRVEDKSLARVMAAGQIVIGIDPSYPPFETIDQHGQVVGFDVDLANYIAGRLGVRAKFVSIDIGSIQDGLIAKKYDAIISSLPPYPEFTKTIAYSRPYFNAGQVLIVDSSAGASQDGKSADARIVSLADLNGKKLGVEAASDADVEVRKLLTGTLHVTIRPYMAADDLVPALKKDEIDAAATDAVTALVFVKDNQGSNDKIKIVGQPLTVEPYVIATRVADGLLLKAIDNALNEMETDGIGVRLQQKWLGGG